MTEKSICLKCPAPTARLDGLCPNCSAASCPAEPRNSEFEALEIEKRGNKCKDCGHHEPVALLLIKDAGYGKTPPKGLMAKYAWSKEARENPDLFYVRCMNCQSRFQRSPGRPRKYKTTTEKRMAKLESARNARPMLKHKVLMAVGMYCINCGEVADGAHWVGEDGQGPLRWEESRRRILKDEEYRQNFRSFCTSCKPLTYFARAKRGEVAKPRHWGNS